MQLFTFGHPCEHQLRRVCIGGTSCPLNGYPDHWCCSFVKGRINFKRDKPCEGARCRWGFAHPPASSFDAVTLVLQEGRACAAKMEEGYGSGALHGGPYTITSPHAADVAHCALNMLRVPPARVATRVGGLLAFAAVKAGDAKIFTQLLKTMKKPVDDYLIGAFEYIHATTAKAAGAAKAKDTTLEDLRHDVISIMCSALSHQGELIWRAEQLPLQTHYLAALKSATRNKKKYAEMLDQAALIFPAAVEAGALVPPETWVRGTRRDSAAPSSAASEADPAGLTPEHKPSTPPASITPTKASRVNTPAQGAAAPLNAIPPDLRAPSLAGKTATSSKGGAAAGSAVAKPDASASRTTAEFYDDGGRAGSFKAAGTAALPSLFSTVEAMGFMGTPPQDYLPVFWSLRNPEPEAPFHIFGGLFALDLNEARQVHVAAEGADRDPFVHKSDTQAPLGAAIREAHAIQAWRAPNPLTASEMEAERRADLQAAAAALAAADAVLE
jgi:hypothetical protein